MPVHAHASATGEHVTAPRCELRFASLFHPGRALAFPCDEQGRVALDDLGERLRRNYLYARAVVGREFATPQVVRATDD